MLKRLTLLVLTTCGLSACERVDPDSPLGQRQAIFQEMLRTSEDLGGMLRGRLPFDQQGFAAGAVKLNALSREPWKHFAPVRDEGQSSARAAVWERQGRFEELAGQLERATAELVAVTQTPPLQAGQLQAPMDRVEAACRACHSEFRNH